MHIALIPDGNRRWAKKRNLLPWQGHQEGARRLEKILKSVLDFDISHFTVWGCSLDNLTKRSKKEVKVLHKIFEDYFKKLLKERLVAEKKIRINFFGRWEKYFSKDLKETIRQLKEKTKTYSRYFLNFLMAYDGKDEMLECIKNIAKKAPKKIDSNIISENLWTGDLPPVDLVIRTGVENDPHNSSGFLMWQTTYSQFYFTKTLFPDFSEKEFRGAITNFLKRERRLGG